MLATPARSARLCGVTPAGLTIVLDLDGVVWEAGVPLAGAADAVARLRAAGHRIAFCTNNGYATLSTHVDRLVAAGIQASVEEVVSSASALATMVQPGQRVQVFAGAGVAEALTSRGAVLVAHDAINPSDLDAIVVGFRPGFGPQLAERAAAGVAGGARFLASNTDPTYPTPTGLVPGSGVIVDMVAALVGRRPEVAGKPNPAVAAALVERVGSVDWVVGDRPDTDGGLARSVEARFALVLCGVTASEEGADPTPDLVGADLAEVVDILLNGHR